MLKQRVFTALLLAVVFLFILFFFPAVLFSAFVVLAVLLAAWEWANLSGFCRAWQRLLYLLLVAALFGATGYATGFTEAGIVNDDAVRAILLIGCGWWALALLWVQSYPQSAVLWGSRWLRALMGLLVLLPTGVALVYLRIQAAGAWLILLVVAVVVCADVGAYFSGKAFGRRKLAPAVSPGKSWEGFWGGLACSVLLALAVSAVAGGLLGYPFDRGYWLPLALIIPSSLASVLGDLLESMVKRHCGLKDSSRLLPGHGGILDRVDSLTAAAPVFAMAFMLAKTAVRA